jgi:hypothetical protein
MAMKSVFVSHATADRELVEQFVDIILKGCGLTEVDIFVSSIPGMDIPAGHDLIATIRAGVSETALVIAVITPTYQTRPYCLAELGAAWAVAGKLLPVLVPGISHDALEGVLAGIKADFLDEEEALDEIAKRIEAETGRRPESPASWTRSKQKWLRIIGDLVNALLVAQIVPGEDYDELETGPFNTGHVLEVAEASSTEGRPEVSLETGIAYARQAAMSGHPPHTITQGRVGPEQPLGYLLAKVTETVWEAISSAGSELEPYVLPLRNYLAALLEKAGRNPARDFALGVLTERVRQEEDGWPDQPGTDEERAGRRQAHGHPDKHLCLLERKHQVEAAIYDVSATI